MPDGIHLHTLIYRRLMRWAVGADGRARLTRGNSMTSPFLWVLTPVGHPGGDLVEQHADAGAVAAGVRAVYLRVYWRIVRFARRAG